MKLRETIEALQKIFQEEGDIEVTVLSFNDEDGWLEDIKIDTSEEKRYVCLSA